MMPQVATYALSTPPLALAAAARWILWVATTDGAGLVCPTTLALSGRAVARSSSALTSGGGTASHLCREAALASERGAAALARAMEAWRSPCPLEGRVGPRFGIASLSENFEPTQRCGRIDGRGPKRLFRLFVGLKRVRVGRCVCDEAVPKSRLVPGGRGVVGNDAAADRPSTWASSGQLGD